MPTLYETHVPVSDLARSCAFYRDVVGLVPAFAQAERNAAFFWVGEKAGGMIGLWGPRSDWGWKTDERHRCHLAIRVTLPALHAAIERLIKSNVGVKDFAGMATREPAVIGWMPSAQIYFDDPDGHAIEFISLLDGAAVPAFFGPWREWLALQAHDRSRRAASPGRPGGTRHFTVSGTKVTDDGLKELTILKGLRRIDLADTQVTDISVKELVKLSALRYLWLGNSKVTEATKKMLKAALPELTING